MREKSFNYTSEQKDDVVIMRIHEDRLDSSLAPSFKTELLRSITSGVKIILINMEQVCSVDSSGLGALTFGQRQLNEVNGSLAVCCLQDKVLTLFKIAKLDRVISIYSSEKDVLSQE